MDLDVFVIKESGPSELRGLDDRCGIRTYREGLGIGRELCDDKAKL